VHDDLTLLRVTVDGALKRILSSSSPMASTSSHFTSLLLYPSQPTSLIGLTCLSVCELATEQSMIDLRSVPSLSPFHVLASIRWVMEAVEDWEPLTIEPVTISTAVPAALGN
jgi:hypothetical protein